MKRIRAFVTVLFVLMLLVLKWDIGMTKNEGVIVKDHTIYVNEVISGDLYVARGATLYIDGNTQISGNLYNWGNVIVSNKAKLQVKQKIYTLRYDNYQNKITINKSDQYMYGYLRNYGEIQSKQIMIDDCYINNKVVINNISYYPKSYKNTNYQSKCIKNVFIEKNMPLANSNSSKNMYIKEGVVCYIEKGKEVNIDGDLYVYGMIHNQGTLKVTGKIYCMHYGVLHASGNTNGIFKNSGKYSCDKIVVATDYFQNQVRNDTHQIKQVIEYAGLYDSGYVVERCVCCGYEISKQTISPIKSITLEQYNYTYDRKSKKPKVIIKTKKNEILDDEYYSVSYDKGRVNSGTYQVKVKLNGYYQGNKTLSFVIMPKNIEQATVSTIKAQTYSNKELTPSIVLKMGSHELKKNSDYTLHYSNNKNAGKAFVTITGINNYRGSKTVSFTIKPADLTKVQIEGLKSLTYTGGHLKQNLKMTYKDLLLRKDVDYTIVYENNRNVGTAKVILEGKGNFKNKVIKTFSIKAKKIDTAIVKMNDKYLYNTGQIKPNVEIYMNEWKLTNNIHYQLKYGSNKSCGEGYIEIKGINNYTGSKKVSFVIAPSGSRLEQIKSNTKNTITVKANKISGAHMQISYRKKGEKTYKHIYTNSEKVTIKNLISNQTYEVKVRHFVKVNEVTYFSEYTPIQKLIVK